MESNSKSDMTLKLNSTANTSAKNSNKTTEEVVVIKKNANVEKIGKILK